MTHPTLLSNQDRIRLHADWWQRTNTERLALIYTPMHYPYGGLDVFADPGDVAQRKRANAAVDHRVPKDTLVIARIDFSTAILPGLLGARFDPTPSTSWAIPTIDSILDVHFPAFDPAHPLYCAYAERQDALLADWDTETLLPATEGYLGPLDLLAGLLGPERLAFALYEHPAEVKARALEAASWLAEVVRYELERFRGAGIRGGTPCAFSYWLPGDGCMFSEDFSALVSRKHFAEFFLEADIAFTQTLDSTLLHIHSAAFQCLPAMLENPHVQAYELANDIDNRDLSKLIRAAQLVQAKGLPVQVSSWEHPLDDTEIERLLGELDPRGLCVALQARSLEEAWRYYSWIKQA